MGHLLRTVSLEEEKLTGPAKLLPSTPNQSVQSMIFVEAKHFPWNQGDFNNHQKTMVPGFFCRIQLYPFSHIVDKGSFSDKPFVVVNSLLFIPINFNYANLIK